MGAVVREGVGKRGGADTETELQGEQNLVASMRAQL